MSVLKLSRAVLLLALIGMGSIGFVAAPATAEEPSAGVGSTARAVDEGSAVDANAKLEPSDLRLAATSEPNTRSDAEPAGETEDLGQDSGQDSGQDLGEADDGSEYAPEDGYDEYGQDDEYGAEARSSEPEEIVVRAAQTNNTAALSISSQSFGSTDLREMRIGDIKDIAKFSPGLEINTAFAASNPTLFIRGIGLKDYNANSAGAVAVYQDGISVNSPAGQLFQLFDVKNVTVLKGPQGGRFGRNATAGAIIVESNKPTGEWGATGSLSLGAYNDVELEGALNFPLIADKLSGRVAFSYDRRDGYTKNGCANWDPVAHGQQLVSKQAITDTYWALDPSRGPVEVVKPNGTHVSEYIYQNSDKIQELIDHDNAAGFKPAKLFDLSGNPVRAQNTRFRFSSGLDKKCIIEDPGSVTTRFGETRPQPNLAPTEGAFNPLVNNAKYEDFQGLKKYTNNVDDWAARMLLLFTPTDNMEWLLNVHGGQNLSDSRHLQQISATTVQNSCHNPDGTTMRPGKICRSPQDFIHPFRAVNTKEPVDGWTEFRAGERAVTIPGLRAPPPAPLSQMEGGQAGGDPYLGWYDADGHEFLDVWGASVTGTWEFERFSLHSITGYEANQRLVEDEGDASPRNLFKTDWSDRAWQVSQEFRIEGETDHFRWHEGVYFLYEQLNAKNEFPAVLGFTWNQFFDQQVISGAPFAHVAWDIFNDDNAVVGVEKLTVEASFRYNVEQKKFGLGSEVFKTAGQAFSQLPPASSTGLWNDPIGDVTVSYTPIDSDLTKITARAKYSRGVKSGHFNAGLTVSDSASGKKKQSTLEPVPPEHIHAIEIGLDTSWLDDMVKFDVAYFRYWYQNLQIFDLVNEPGSIPTQQLLHSNANVYGVEASVTAVPVEGLEIGARVNWVRSTFEDFFVNKREAAGGGAGGGKRNNRKFDYSGNSTVASPEWTLHGHAQYDLPLDGWGYLTPRFDATYQTRVFLDPQGLDLIGWPAYWLFDARLAYRTPDERIELAAWVNNLADKRYAIDVFDVSREFRTILLVYGEPRMFGMTLSLLY